MPQGSGRPPVRGPEASSRPHALRGWVTPRSRTDRQIAALEAAGCARVFADKTSGKNAERDELRKCLDYLRPGDTLVVPSLARLGRSIQDLISIVSGLCKRGIGFQSLHEALDTTTPGSRLVFHVFAALAEFIRELIVQGTHEGLATARARGERIGRPPAMTVEQVRHARGLLTDPENTITSIAKLLGVSRTTLYKYVPELRVGRDALVSGDRGQALPGPRRPYGTTFRPLPGYRIRERNTGTLAPPPVSPARTAPASGLPLRKVRPSAARSTTAVCTVRNGGTSAEGSEWRCPRREVRSVVGLLSRSKRWDPT
ncbi:recombinase family protein [Streptomyces mirabilis]|uniref:recombinase family protein n=1 Tax=Streptomyces mirabilis TaxID=68239 RepID=UPI0033AE0548